MQRYPDPFIKRPPRYLPPVRRTRSGRLSPVPTLPKRANNHIKQLSSASNTTSNDGDTKCKTKAKKAEKKLPSGISTEKKTVGTGSESGKSASLIDSSIDSAPLLPPAESIASPLPAPPPPPPPPPPPAPPLLPPPLPSSQQEPKLVSRANNVESSSPKNGEKSKTEENTYNAKQKGTSDTIELNQIILARQNLRKQTGKTQAEKSPTDINDDMMALIRSGVKLKKVDRDKYQKEKGLSDIAASMLRNTLDKMNKHMRESSDEDSSDGEFI